MDELKPIHYTPIGIFRCNQTDPSHSPRQPSLARSSQGTLELSSNYIGHCLDDLAGFSHLWLVYDFHLNKKWKPKVRPPRGGEKRGVFATRSPYRPNSIGLSVVELLEVNGSSLKLKAHDLLDQTPILDIKPYLPYADSIPLARGGWTADLVSWNVEFNETMIQKLEWLSTRLRLDLKAFLIQQLQVDPTDSHAKRVRKVDDQWWFSYKTWRFQFVLEEQKVRVLDVGSGYSQVEIQDLSSDPYEDKLAHVLFLELFSK